MDKKGTSVVISGAAILALLFSPVGQKALAPTPSPLPTKEEAVVPVQSESDAGSTLKDSLLEDNDGPWYALCSEFADYQAHNDSAASEILLPGNGRVDKEISEFTEKFTVQNATLEHRFRVHEHPIRVLSSCVQGSPTPELQFLIVTVPDPFASHLSVDFDRYVEAIQHGAGFVGFDFERYWMPWRPTAGKTLERGTVEPIEPIRGQQPGLLIFRKRAGRERDPGAVAISDTWLLVFLVGETPTSGLNRIVFENALGYISQLQNFTNSRQKQVVNIVGPTFSASYSPLADSLLSSNNSMSQGNFNIVNPDSSAASLIKGFKLKLDASPLAGRFTYSALEFRTCRAIDEWRGTMVKLGYRERELAVIGEDESAYGTDVAGFSKESDLPTPAKGHITLNDSWCDSHKRSASLVHLQFPRDLSSLRNAAEALPQPVLPSDFGEFTLPQFGVPLTLRQELSNERDSPPSFASDQSPARVDRALQALVRRLRLERIQSVILTATNPLDLIFLLDYLHRSLPDVRLATFGADEFMLGRPKHVDLSGTLVITGMPLLPDHFVELRETAAQLSLGKEPAKRASPTAAPSLDRVDFPSTNSEGMFLAVLELLSSDKPKSADAVRASCASVNVVGKNGFRLLDERGENGTFPCSGPQTAMIVDLPELPIPWAWICFLILLAILTSGHLVTLVTSLQGEIGATSAKSPLKDAFIVKRLFASVAIFRRPLYICRGDSPVVGVKMFFLLVLTNQLLLLEWIVTTVNGALWATFSGLQWFLFGLHFLLLVLTALSSCFLLYKVFQHCVSSTKGEELRSIPGRFVVSTSVIFVLCTMYTWWEVLGDARGWPFDKAVALRSVQVFDGLSPICPIAIILFAYALWAVNNLSRLKLRETRQVELALPTDSRVRVSYDRLAKSINTSIVTPPLSLLIVTLATLLLFRVIYVLRGIDSSSFSAWMIWWGFFSLLLTILMTMNRAWDIWIALRQVLEYLSTTTIVTALEDVPKELSTMQIWRIGGGKVPFDLQARALESLETMCEKDGGGIESEQAGPMLMATGTEGVPHSMSVPVESRNAVSDNAKVPPPIAMTQQINERGNVAVDVKVTGPMLMATGTEGGHPRLDTPAENQNVQSCDKPLSLVDTRLALEVVRTAYERGDLPSFDDVCKLSKGLNVRMKEAGELITKQKVKASGGDQELHGLKLYLCYRFISLVRYAMLQCRNMLTFVLYGYAALLLSVTAYPFQGRRSLGSLMSIVFVLLLVGVTVMLMQMDRDSILRRLEPTKGFGEAFGMAAKILSVGGVPLFAVLASQFPSIAEFVMSWIRPAIEATH